MDSMVFLSVMSRISMTTMITLTSRDPPCTTTQEGTPPDHRGASPPAVLRTAATVLDPYKLTGHVSVST